MQNARTLGPGVLFSVVRRARDTSEVS